MDVWLGEGTRKWHRFSGLWNLGLYICLAGSEVLVRGVALVKYILVTVQGIHGYGYLKLAMRAELQLKF